MSSVNAPAPWLHGLPQAAFYPCCAVNVMEGIWTLDATLNNWSDMLATVMMHPSHVRTYICVCTRQLYIVEC